MECFGVSWPATSKILEVSPSRWLPVLLLLVLCSALGKVPVLDEESYLAIAAQIVEHPARPYDWWRVWQPWGSQQTDNAFLFAHPPLHLWWVSAWQQGVGTGLFLRLGVALPWVLLLGFSMGRLSESVCLRGGRACLLFVASPVVVLAVQSGLMMDLALAALSTAAVAAWWSFAEGDNRRDAWLAGICLALACATKYPGLVLVPVFLLHARKRGMLRRAWPVWVAFGVLWGGLEAYLAVVYGKLHLLTVLSTASEISRGSFLPRAFGVWVRLGLVACPLLFLAESSLRRGALLGLVVTAALLPVAMGPDSLAWPEIGLLFLLGSGGGAACWTALRAMKTAMDDVGLLLGSWAFLGILAVVLGHNYAAGRYLLPVAVPLVLLFERRVERSASGGGGWVRPAVAAWGLLAGLMAHSEYRQAAAVETLVEGVVRGEPAGKYAGEWTFRWKMRELGWSIWHPGDDLVAGERLYVPVNSGPFEVPKERLRLLEQHASPERFPIRVLDQSARIGYHGETLGILPVGISTEPMERIRIYEVSW